MIGGNVGIDEEVVGDGGEFRNRYGDVDMEYSEERGR